MKTNQINSSILLFSDFRFWIIAAALLLCAVITAVNARKLTHAFASAEKSELLIAKNVNTDIKKPSR